MEANTGILKDLASREAALTLRVEAAKAEALKIVAEAEVKAKDAFSKAQSDASALEAICPRVRPRDCDMGQQS